jgi:anaerobic magnesium-protoporphyrin IX monomethyl ester cyclase
MSDLHHNEVLLLGFEDEENLGLRYIAAYLKLNGVSTDIIPIQNFDKSKLLEIIILNSPKIVGFSMIFQRMLPEFAELIVFLRENGVRCHFTMGGHFPTIEYEKTLNLIPGLDSIIRHEGELTLLELYKNISKPEDWSEIRGMAFRNKEHIHATAPRPLIENLDDIPFPVRSDRFQNHRGIGISTLITSRGCYYNCSFCSIHEFYGGAPGKIRRSRSPENVVREMKNLFEKGSRIFIFKDDDFGMSQPRQKQWIERFVHELGDSHLIDKIAWRISCRIDEVDAEMVELLKNAGLMYLYLGIESGCNQGLETFNKHYTVEDIYDTLGILERINMNFEYGFMIFDPDSSLSSLKENMHFLNNLCKDGRAIVHFTKMFPYVGTQITKRLEKEGRLEGPVESPDYKYKDPRMDLLQLFFNKTFYIMLFDKRGLVNKLQYARFDAAIMQRFFNEFVDVKKYQNDINRLTRTFNASALDTMGLIVNFMESRNRKEIWQDWTALEKIVDEELSIHNSISQALDDLIPPKSLVFHPNTIIY